MKTPEGYEKDEICKYLDSINAWYFRKYSAGFGKSGIPDLVGVWSGHFFSIEVKREGKTPTKLQEQRMWEIAQSGGKVFWGTSAKVVKEFERWREIRGTVMDIDSNVAHG